MDLATVWRTDAPAGQAWKCPDCDSWATLGGNAGWHAEKSGHGVPSLGPIPPREARAYCGCGAPLTDTGLCSMKGRQHHGLPASAFAPKLTKVTDAIGRCLQLKPCPFCGGAAGFAETIRSGREAVLVRCTGCGSEGQWAKSELQAGWQWNRRTEVKG